MIKCKDNYIGIKFNHLTVIKQVNDYVSKSGRPKAQFLCQCDCNKLNPNTIIVRLDSLKNGHTSSCGCVKSKTTIIRNTKRKKPLSDKETLELNLIDDNHKEFGKCKLSEIGKWFYFSMCDYDTIKNYHWYVHVDKRTGYCSLKTMFNGTPLSMHQILHIQRPDHINRNPLDSRRKNLDECASSIIQAQNRGLQRTARNQKLLMKLLKGFTHT